MGATENGDGQITNNIRPPHQKGTGDSLRLPLYVTPFRI